MKIPNWFNRTVIILLAAAFLFTLIFGGYGVGNKIFIGWFENTSITYEPMSVYGGMILLTFLIFIALMFFVIKFGKVIWGYFKRETKNR